MSTHRSSIGGLVGGNTFSNLEENGIYTNQWYQHWMLPVQLRSRGIYVRFRDLYGNPPKVLENVRLSKNPVRRKMDSIRKDAIQFTVVRQEDGRLPFLNGRNGTMVEIKNGIIEVDVYRKPTR